MNLKDYITEYVSSGRGKRKKSIGPFTSEMNMDDFFINLEDCGIKWKPQLKSSVKMREIVASTIDSWSYNYDALDVGNGITILVIVTQRKCFVLYWSTSSKRNSGPVEATYHILPRPSKDPAKDNVMISDSLEEVIDYLNEEMEIASEVF